MTTGDERTRALRFAREDAGFAQVFTFDSAGQLVGRTASAFLNDDWTVDTVQRATHRRVTQLERDGRVLVMWNGEPAADSVNDSPWTFDLGLTIPRVVFVRGLARALDNDATWAVYHRHSERLRASGHTKAPVRDRDDIEKNFAGVRIEPHWIRLEGFGQGAESFTWTIRPSS